MNINWSKWSAIAEIISSVAILVTLIYLSIQTHQNLVATQTNTRQTMISNDVISLGDVTPRSIWNQQLFPVT